MDLTELLRPEHDQDKYKLHLSGPTLAILSRYRDEVLTIREKCPGIILAGGAVRDVYFDRLVKDWDFMTVNQDDITRLSTVLENPLLHCLRGAGTKTDYEPSSLLLDAYETEDKSINLLLVKSIMGRINEFPDSISQCWFDGMDVCGTPAFCATALTEVVTYDPKIKPERLEKLKSKYPDFKFVPTT